MKNYDVIIIGGGFAGVTSARELSRKGYKSLLLEARDRLGGRTWTDKQLGRKLEIGGTWVHWLQPHVWSEITRYNLETIEGPCPEEAYWIADNELEKGTPDDLLDIIGSGMKQFANDCQDYVPKPYEPLLVEKIKDIDHLSVADRIAELNLSKKEFDLLYSMWALNFNGSPKLGGLTQAFRWLALSNKDWKLAFEICASYKLAKGTEHLVECIANDADTDFLLSKPVSRVEKSQEGYRVTTKEGEEFFGKTVVTTLPLNILNSIEFIPGLSSQKQTASVEGQTSTGLKVWAKVRNIDKPFIAMAPADYPINFVQYEYDGDGEAILVGFGSDSTKLDPKNKVEVEKALRQWIPDIEVIESTGHDWIADEYSGQTWPMARTNQLSKYHAELQRPEGGLFLAGSDYADGWLGMIDGAIESAFKVSSKVDQYLQETTNKRSIEVLKIVDNLILDKSAT